MNRHTAWNTEEAHALLAGMATMPGPALAMLQAIQARFGHVPAEAVPLVADAANLSRAEIHGVLTFYHDLRTRPPAARVIHLCRAEACQSVGAEALAAEAARLGCPPDAAEDTAQVAVESTYCLGNCALGPAAMVDGELVAHLTPAGLAALLSGAPAEAVQAPRMTALKLFLPADAAALSVGANAVARALEAEAARRGIALTLVRTGSRGLLWLEPLLEAESPAGRLGFANLRPADVPALFDAGFPATGHPRALGPVEQLPAWQRQTRLVFARTGITDPLSLADYRAHGGLAGLEAARAMPPDAILQAVAESGLRGRGGAGFPTGIKWRTVAAARAERKYIVCNADEGDSGTFADRMLIEGDPFLLIEGMAIAARAVGASQGYIYLRSEYPHAERTLRAALSIARAEAVLGPDFDIELRMGAGAYICGEETALLESLEGKRGIVRAKPPLPAIAGLFGMPTVVNNVLSLATIPAILAAGPEAHAAHGIGRSRGTLAVQLAGNVARGGLYELPFGLTLRDVVHDIGGGTRSGRPVRAVQVGGPLGAYLPATMLDTPLDYEALAAAGGMLGHGGVVVFDDTVDMARQARFAFEFCARESCGKCTPCRIGATRGMETIDRIVAGHDREKHLAVVADLAALMTDASLCAMGGLTPLPVQSALRHFPEDFRAP